MKYPSLVPPSVCRTPIRLTLYADELSENGAPVVVFTYEGRCNYQDSAARVYTDDKHYIQLSGKALFTGDLCPDMEEIAHGEAEIFGETRTVYRGAKARNPDGSVNYTQIEWM